tara:strand:- start:393 stop:773 length:381 start_codon:yes stop_codon:yes gene_type:complete
MSEQSTPYQVKNIKRGEKTVTGRVIGRDKTVVPEDEFFKLAQLHCTWKELAEHFCVKENTLRDNFRDLYIKGHATTSQRLRQKALDMAFSGDRVMLIFSLKNLAGWSDNPQGQTTETVLPWNTPEQ